MESQSKSRIGKQKLSKYITLERLRGLQWERDALTIHSTSPPPRPSVCCRALDMDEHIHHRTAQELHTQLLTFFYRFPTHRQRNPPVGRSVLGGRNLIFKMKIAGS